MYLHSLAIHLIIVTVENVTGDLSRSRMFVTLLFLPRIRGGKARRKQTVVSQHDNVSQDRSSP